MIKVLTLSLIAIFQLFERFEDEFSVLTELPWCSIEALVTPTSLAGPGHFNDVAVAHIIKNRIVINVAQHPDQKAGLRVSASNPRDIQRVLIPNKVLAWNVVYLGFERRQVGVGNRSSGQIFRKKVYVEAEMHDAIKGG